MRDFANWLGTTGLSTWIKINQAWVIPSVQTVHILGIGIVIGSVFLIAFRVLGLAAMDQTLRQVNRRFTPWIFSAFWVLLATGTILLIGEPARELISFSFWVKMTCLAIGLAVALSFSRLVSSHDEEWDEVFVKKTAVKVAAVATMVVWLCVILMGRLIAYDHVWGKLSPVQQY